ncbi:glycosyltransferase family 2 protein [Microbacterium flavescens]|jgi:GT2 family glycosyltransferase|uniref:glycosyltransferase family 2 protein n=1 Tax=Microbacterium flavescens TaxID=69366 RepID=UPI001BDDD7F0|nr:glycosyltransferase family 2 protein [Microbacterium flavescens]BFF09368.1 glycosyltransferase family 2 protein [Microbacterium flavescens]
MTVAFRTSGPVDVAVVVVTYNSARDIGALVESLRAETQDLSMRVVVADNASTDATLAELARHPDLVTVPTGGNLGYSGGINVAMRHVGDADAVLILNPDLRVERGAVRTLRRSLAARSGAGIVAPRIRDASGGTASSLHNEPRISRSLADAVLGRFWQRRPAALSESVRDPAQYETARRMDWATGAALLVSRDAAATVGEWDERFFLYSEETDYCRRVRRAGYEVWYEPTAIVHHSQGGSGSSGALDRLLAVNRIRYARKHHSAAWTAAYRGTVIMGEFLRSARAQHRATLRTVASGRTWASLPHSGAAAPQQPAAEGGA